MSKITFKGITQNSSISKPITDEVFCSIEDEFYAKPDIELVKEQLKKVHKGSTKVNYIYQYFFKKVASKAIGPGASWSIWDGIHNREIMEYFAGKFANSPKFYPDTLSFAQNLDVAFRLCGIRYCVKCPNYPLKSIQVVLEKYNVNNVWYDYSCGWGNRLLGALQAGVEYWGTDPNYELTEELHNLEKLYKEVNNVDTPVHILTQGSEIIIPEMRNKVGLAFSSPPYFDLEDYQIGEQSYKAGTTYEEWLNSYLYRTIFNIYEYLIEGGYFLINVKNYRSNKNGIVYPIEDDVKKFIKESEIGFEFVESVSLKNIKRCHGDVKNTTGTRDKTILINNDENILVFKKI